MLAAGPGTRFRLVLPDRTETGNDALEQALRRALRDCGCVESSVALVLGTAVSIAAWLFVPQAPLWALIVGPLIVAVAAKLAGGQRGRRELRRLIADAEAGTA